MNRACTCLLVAICPFILCIALGVLGADIYGKYSTIYKDVEIGSASVSLSGVSVSPPLSLSFHLDIRAMLKNPNEYQVKIKSPKAGRILFAPDKEEVGKIAVVPITLPELTDKELLIDGVIELRGFRSISVISRFLRGQVNLYLEISFDALIEESLLVKSLAIQVPFEKKCGATVDIMAGETGDLACGEAFEELQFCEIRQSSCSGVICVGETCMSIDEEVIEDAENMRDTYLGLIMGLSFGFAFLIVLCTIAVFIHQFREQMWHNRLKTDPGNTVAATSVGNSLQ